MTKNDLLVSSFECSHVIFILFKCLSIWSQFQNGFVQVVQLQWRLQAYFPEPGHFTNHSSGQDWNHYIDVNNWPEKVLEPFEESYPVISIGCLSITSGHSFIMALYKCASFSDEWIHEEKWKYWSGSGRDLQKSCFGSTPLSTLSVKIDSLDSPVCANGTPQSLVTWAAFQHDLLLIKKLSDANFIYFRDVCYHTCHVIHPYRLDIGE